MLFAGACNMCGAIRVFRGVGTEMTSFEKIAKGLAAVACVASAMLVTPLAHQPPGAAPQAPVWQIPRVPAVDRAAHDRGKVLWAAQCVDCHGPQARGSEKGPNIIRTQTVNFDRTGREVGSVLGPFLKKGHPTQTGKPSASFTADEVIALANFLRERVNETMRSSPTFTAGDVLVGDPKAGAEFFNGAGGCAT